MYISDETDIKTKSITIIYMTKIRTFSLNFRGWIHSPLFGLS